MYHVTVVIVTWGPGLRTTCAVDLPIFSRLLLLELF
jgi:hypothetical protein